MSEWISVADKLPEAEVKVLTWSKYDWGAKVGYYGAGWNFDRWDDGHQDLPYVTHWQPLPEPPNG